MTLVSHPIRAMAAGILIACVAGCSTTGHPTKADNPQANNLAGTLTYQEKISLPSGTRVHLTILDRSHPGTGPIANTNFAAKGEVPIAFAMSVPDLSEDGDYALYAQIIVAGRSWFTNASSPTRIDAAGLPIMDLEILLRNDMRPLGIVPGS